MQNTDLKSKVSIPIEIMDYLSELTDTLLNEDYFSYIEPAESLVDDILNFIWNIPCSPHYKLTEIAQSRFKRYGKNMQYAFFKRKSSKQTTWYIFFSRQDDRYIIRYITNNHKDGKYIRNYITDKEE